MTPEAILILTKDSGFTQVHQRGIFMCSLPELIALADSIKSKTREECAKACETWATSHANDTGECDYSTCDMVAVAVDLAAKIRSGT